MYQKYVKYYGNEHIFDIFENKRLYASPYQNLNDCAEGDFYIGENWRNGDSRFDG